MRNIPTSIIRQPPRPRPRRLPAADLNEEPKSEVPPLKVRVPPDEQIDGGKTVQATRTYYYPMRCKRKSPMSIESLPDEVLFEILSRIPGQYMYEAMLVSRKWYRMIHTHEFIQAQIEHTTHGLLFISNRPDFDSIIMHAREGQAEISKFRCRRMCKVKTSCNGLMLKDEEHKTENIYISNPTTGQIFVLPPFVGGAYSNTSGIAYASASMAYKVVLPISPGGGMKEKCYILTVGVDKSWRAVDLGHLSIEVTFALRFPPVITEGFIHWLRAENNTVLTLNVETETITKTPGPRPSRGILEHQVNIYLSTGKYLSLLRPCGEFSWQVWEMRPEIGEWRKMGSVCLESQRRRFKQLGLIQPTEVNTRPLFKLRTDVVPVGWVKYMEVLALSSADVIRRTIFTFNLVTGEFDEMELPSVRLDYTIMLHKSSLVWLCG